MTLTYIDIAPHLPATAAEIAAIFAEMVTVDDTTSWTTGSIFKKLGASKTIAIRNAIDAAGVNNPIIRDCAIALATKDGLTLHEPERQVMIDLLGLSAELTADVKALGRPQVTRWVSLGKTTPLPTEQEISDVIAAKSAADAIEAKAAADAIEAKAAADAIEAVDAARVAVENEILNAAYVAADRTKTSLAAAYRQAADALEAN